MKNSGYTQEEQRTYYVEIELKDHDVEQLEVYVNVKEYVKPPDYTSWESELDFYGYTEVLDWNIEEVNCGLEFEKFLYENQNEQENLVERRIKPEIYSRIHASVSKQIGE